MCRAKPYPRCSDHALKSLQKALQRHEEEATPESSQAVKEAQITYLLTPAGEMMLRKQNLNDIADKSKKERRKLNAEAKRFLKYSTAVEKLDPEWMGDSNLIPDLTNPTIAKAYALAVSCHSGVKRKSGEPYVNHPLRWLHEALTQPLMSKSYQMTAPKPWSPISTLITSETRTGKRR